MNAFRTHVLLAPILVVYAILGGLFAAFTPDWQAPDEPAHYNYVRYLVENGRFPVLHMGDYPHSYLEEIKARRFPADMSIDSIRYEFHQPPLYYALTAPVYALTNGNLVALRMFSVLLGAGIVLLAYAIARRIFPDRPAMALGTAAFVAFLPQHLVTVSQVGNDVLAELLVALALYQMVGWVMGRGQTRTNAEKGIGNLSRPSLTAFIASFGLLQLGIVLGLILITKTTAYVVVPLAVVVLIWGWWRQRSNVKRILAELVLVGAPVVLFALPWYARDIWVYGWPDFLGLGRHDAIVIGQLRTHEFLIRYGWDSYLQRLIAFTFKSFWGVFGWLGVFMDSRVYFALALLSGAAAAGFVLRLIQRSNRESRIANDESRIPQSALCLLAFSAMLTVLAYGWYNRQFVQHQGRYLFTALIPIALAFAIGWQEALRPRISRLLVAALVLLGIGLAVWGAVSGVGLPRWPLALTAAFAGGLAVRIWMPKQLDALPFALPYVGFPLLALYALFGAIVPQLAG